MKTINGYPKKKWFNAPGYVFGRSIDDIFEDNFFGAFNFNNDVWETENEYEVQIPVPGMSRKDLSISVTDGVMYVKGKKEHKRKSWWKKDVVEWDSRMFHRSLVLPENADPDHISARCKNGLLTIRIAKKSTPGAYKKIDITDIEDAKVVKSKRGWMKQFRNRLKKMLKSINK